MGNYYLLNKLRISSKPMVANAQCAFTTLTAEPKSPRYLRIVKYGPLEYEYLGEQFVGFILTFPSPTPN